MKIHFIDLNYCGFRIETGYDRKSRSWISQLKDGHGNQVGSAYYDGTKDGVSMSQQMLRTRAMEIRPPKFHKTPASPRFGY